MLSIFSASFSYVHASLISISVRPREWARGFSRMSKSMWQSISPVYRIKKRAKAKKELEVKSETTWRSYCNKIEEALTDQTPGRDFWVADSARKAALVCKREFDSILSKKPTRKQRQWISGKLAKIKPVLCFLDKLHGEHFNEYLRDFIKAHQPSMLSEFSRIQKLEESAKTVSHIWQDMKGLYDELETSIDEILKSRLDDEEFAYTSRIVQRALRFTRMGNASHRHSRNNGAWSEKFAQETFGYVFERDGGFVNQIQGYEMEKKRLFLLLAKPILQASVSN